jgi:excisionase family DNA binding protein
MCSRRNLVALCCRLTLHARQDVRQVAISRSKVYRLVDTGRLPDVKLGRSRRIRWEDVLRLHPVR